MCNGVAGAVLDGYCRDFAQVRDIEMPVFAKGPPMRIRGGHIAFTEYNVPINCAGARVCPGDYVLGDIDGVLCFRRTGWNRLWN
jgi:regulator of RNase E activity RraA